MEFPEARSILLVVPLQHIQGLGSRVEDFGLQGFCCKRAWDLRLGQGGGGGLLGASSTLGLVNLLSSNQRSTQNIDQPNALTTPKLSLPRVVS